MKGVKSMSHKCGDVKCCGSNSFVKELVCHLPYSILSVALSLVVVSIMNFIAASGVRADSLKPAYHMLFHNFHFLHIVFAVTGSMVMFSKYSKNIFAAIIVSVITSSFFCVLSDILFPYIGGRLLGANMSRHICFFCDYYNISIFLVIGIVNGLAQVYRGLKVGDTNTYLVHGLHIVISSLASTFYLVAHGFVIDSLSLGYVFILLLIAVVIPCTMSDVLVPMFVAISGRKK